jgi:FtsH-binding integral membrane protein
MLAEYRKETDMYRNILCSLALGWVAALLVTNLAYFLLPRSMAGDGLLQWTTPILLFFTFALLAGIGMRRNLNSSDCAPDTNSGLPTDIAFGVISKWGMR